jgi:urease accessory protein
MLRAIRLIPKAEVGSAGIAGTITLDRQSRYRRRVLLKADSGHDLMLDLETATYMADGDMLELADGGGFIRVIAAPEPLLEIHVTDPLALARVAWHIGNRHTPAEITAHAIYIQPDHVLEEMVTGHGAHVHHVVRPFEPEGGAYGGKGPLLESHHGHAHTRAHTHSESHSHSHGEAHAHAHASASQGAIGKRIPVPAKKS